MQEGSIILPSPPQSLDMRQPSVALCLAQCPSTSGTVNLCHHSDEPNTSPWQLRNMICNQTTTMSSRSLVTFLPNERASIWKQSPRNRAWILFTKIFSLQPFYFHSNVLLTIYYNVKFQCVDSSCRPLETRSCIPHPAFGRAVVKLAPCLISDTLFWGAVKSDSVGAEQSREPFYNLLVFLPHAPACYCNDTYKLGQKCNGQKNTMTKCTVLCPFSSCNVGA